MLHDTAMNADQVFHIRKPELTDTHAAERAIDHVATLLAFVLEGVEQAIGRYEFPEDIARAATRAARLALPGRSAEVNIAPRLRQARTLAREIAAEIADGRKRAACFAAAHCAGVAQRLVSAKIATRLALAVPGDRRRQGWLRTAQDATDAAADEIARTVKHLVDCDGASWFYAVAAVERTLAA